MRGKRLFLLILMAGFCFSIREAVSASTDTLNEPEIVIPSCQIPPVIDGSLSPGEWQYAATLTGLRRLPGTDPQKAKGVRIEQAVFYLCRSGDDLYIAMDSSGTTHTEILASCVMHDSSKICEDDALELMVAPGTGREIEELSFACYYILLNAIGTSQDMKIVKNYNEVHNSWTLPLDVRSTVTEQHWVCEMKFPLRAFGGKAPRDGDRWRMNFVRTYPKYIWSAWRIGAFNSPYTGGDVTFDSSAPAVRVLSMDSLLSGKLALEVEIANATSAAKTVGLRLSERDSQETLLMAEEKLTVGPAGVKKVSMGKGESFSGEKVVVLEVVEMPGNKRLYYNEYQMVLPGKPFVVKPAPVRSDLYLFARYIPSRERLAVVMNYIALSAKKRVARPLARITVKKKDDIEPFLTGEFRDFLNGEGTWRHDTGCLSEGEYTVDVDLYDGETKIASETDWFEKRHLEWLENPVGCGDDVPAPFTPLKISGRSIMPWGRTYTFDRMGLPAGIVSQGRELLAGQARLTGSSRGTDIAWNPVQPMRFTNKTGNAVEFESEFTGNGIKASIHGLTEYDGFIKYRLTYAPEKPSSKMSLDSLKLSIPLKTEHSTYFSALADSVGTNIVGGLLPDRQGVVLDSVNDMQAVALPPNFTSLLWLGDRDVSFCYVGDSDEGWWTEETKPCLEVERRGKSVILHLNFINKPLILEKPRSITFALQAGPVKPLPRGWRGICHGSDTTIGPTPWNWSCTGYWNFPAGAQLIHPGYGPEDWKKSANNINKKVPEGIAPVEYNWYAHVPKIPEVRVLRGELGIDRATWESKSNMVLYKNNKSAMEVLGEDIDRYTVIPVNPVPSYVDLLTYGFDLAVEHTRIEGFYDDQGYPRPVFDEELNLGYVREDGKKIPCAGIFIYRERWKRAAYVLWKHGRRNFLSDTQHIAHIMPVYGFCGIFNGCEGSYTKHGPDTWDNMDWFGSMERYAALSPAQAMGMVPVMSLTTSETKDKENFRRETRCMLMLTLLNDQDIGGWKVRNRDGEEIDRARKARNTFEPWSDDVRYLGYWQNPVESSVPEFLTSVYYAPRGALLIIGNIDKKDANGILKPDWKRLGLSGKRLILRDAETGEAIPVKQNGEFSIGITGHDFRMVIAGIPER